jgi:hypothetical protein
VVPIALAKGLELRFALEPQNEQHTVALDHVLEQGLLQVDLDVRARVLQAFHELYELETTLGYNTHLKQ